MRNCGEEMRTEIKKLHQRLGATIIYVTHDQVEAMTLADHCCLERGQDDAVCQPSNIYNTPAATFVAGFTGSPHEPRALPGLQGTGSVWERARSTFHQVWPARRLA